MAEPDGRWIRVYTCFNGKTATPIGWLCPVCGGYSHMATPTCQYCEARLDKPDTNVGNKDGGNEK